MRLILLTSAENYTNEYKIINDLFDNGLEILHLRKPNFPIHMLEQYIQQIQTKYHNRIVLHSHFDLCKKYNLRGIHLGKKYRNRKFRTWFKVKLLKFSLPKLRVSTTFHSIKSLSSSFGSYRYIFLSPVFDSISNKGKMSRFDLGELTDYLKHTHHQVVALGGIDKDKLEIAQNMGFKAVALYGDVWKSEDPVKSFREIRQRLLELAGGSNPISQGKVPA